MGNPQAVAARRVLFPVLAAVLTLALTLILLAVYFAVRVRQDPFPRIPMRLTGDWILEADAATGFVPKPGGSTKRLHLDTGIEYEIHTDSRGARVDLGGRETAERVAILTVGGSYSHGHGVNNEETFTARLGKGLEVPVANLAFSSFGTVQSAVLLERNLDLEPRVVVYGFIEDHLRRNLAPCAPSYAPYCLPVAFIDFDGEGRPFLHPPEMKFFTPEQNRAFFYDVLMKDGFGWRDILWRARIDLFRIQQSSRVSYVDDSVRRSAAMRFLLDRMVAATRRIDARLIVTHLPSPLTARPLPPPPPELLDALSGRDLEFLDMGEALEALRVEKGPESLFLAPGDGHPSRFAHEVIGESLARLIESRDLLGDRRSDS